MAGKVLNFKVCSPLKQHSGLTGKKPAICHYSYNLPLCVSEKKPRDSEYYSNIKHLKGYRNYDMKKIMIFLVIGLASISAFAQSTSEAPIQNISTDSTVVYRLFSTRNMYTFIKLNTRNGQMWQVQWSTESQYRFETILSDIPRINKEEEKNGRFFLYPTTNIYNFILLDQIDGRVWQVQWGKEKERMVIRIY